LVRKAWRRKASSPHGIPAVGQPITIVRDWTVSAKALSLPPLIAVGGATVSHNWEYRGNHGRITRQFLSAARESRQKSFAPNAASKTAPEQQHIPTCEPDAEAMNNHFA